VPEIARRLGDLATTDAAFPDERLKLMFVCAHPAIDVAVRTPLMLQTVLGLDAARIASAFLVAPATMGQRLVRAKAKIRAAGVRFAVPEPDDLPERLADILDAVYAAYGTGWEAVAGFDPDVAGLAEEAIYLGRLLVALIPEAAEAKGLLSLMLHCEARHLMSVMASW
jgi:RNA polymerase sigma-70 factor (ECF subfamily)